MKFLRLPPPRPRVAPSPSSPASPAPTPAWSEALGNLCLWGRILSRLPSRTAERVSFLEAGGSQLLPCPPHPMGVARCSLQLVSRWSQHSPGKAGLGLQRGTSWGGGGEQTQLGLEQGWGRVSDTPAPNRNSPRGSLTTWEAQAARPGAQLPSLAGPRPALQTCRADPRRWGSSTAGLPTGRPSGARSWYKAGFVRPRGRASQASVTLRVACGFPRRGGPFRMKFPSRNTSCRRGCPAPQARTLCVLRFLLAWRPGRGRVRRALCSLREPADLLSQSRPQAWRPLLQKTSQCLVPSSLPARGWGLSAPFNTCTRWMSTPNSCPIGTWVFLGQGLKPHHTATPVTPLTTPGPLPSEPPRSSSGF